MTTHERELTEPVDLCTPDGLRLNPGARGWSRRPLHRANLIGRFGINKRWDYWAILAGDLVVSTTYADVDHLGLADVYWANLVTGQTGGRSIVVGAESGISLPEIPSTAPLEVDQDSLTLRIADDERGTHFTAHWTEADGRPGRLEAFAALPEGHESLNVVIPWSDELFNFTSKHQARPARGVLLVGDERYEFGGPGRSLAWGVLDVGRGRWPARINWNWGGGAGPCGDHVIGLQFGAKWTSGSGFTENGLIVDGRLSKLGSELDWSYDWDRPMDPWRVVDPNGQLQATLVPRFDRHSQMEVSEELGSEVHQVFGTWSGRLRTDDGMELEFDGLQGFAEEARQRW
jgi:hypothetical protein